MAEEIFTAGVYTSIQFAMARTGVIGFSQFVSLNWHRVELD
jgi:hypothetical protein